MTRATTRHKISFSLSFLASSPSPSIYSSILLIFPLIPLYLSSPSFSLPPLFLYAAPLLSPSSPPLRCPLSLPPHCPFLPSLLMPSCCCHPPQVTLTQPHKIKSPLGILFCSVEAGLWMGIFLYSLDVVFVVLVIVVVCFSGGCAVA